MKALRLQLFKKLYGKRQTVFFKKRRQIVRLTQTKTLDTSLANKPGFFAPYKIHCFALFVMVYIGLPISFVAVKQTLASA